MLGTGTQKQDLFVNIAVFGKKILENLTVQR